MIGKEVSPTAAAYSSAGVDAPPAPAYPAGMDDAPARPAAGFAHVRHWVFDLDNTLYAPEVRLFDRIHARMTGYVMRTLGLDRAAADRLRHGYWRAHGTTLAGLMREHGHDPLPYLAEVHDIPLDGLAPDPALARAIAALPGRRVVHTNGSAAHAERVLEARGLSGAFHAVYGVEHAQFRPKPERAAFETVFALAGVVPEEGAIFEDDPRNLAAPHDMGLCTVLVGDAGHAPHIRYRTDDLTGFLHGIAPADGAPASASDLSII